MNPERFGRLREIVLTAAALPEQRRASYLERACRDDLDLRREAESLLLHEKDAPRLAATAGIQQALEAFRCSTDAAAGRALPERIGPYRILGVLGEGGMGTVYRAEQLEPIRREVALKLIRHGADSAAVVARFESERRTLALMDHPNVARVLDAGADEHGKPYFVMELVHGVPITAYARGNGLGARERLHLFLDVCRAVAHAHRKGIIHRDLKPSNVLVTAVHGEPVAKVIDFSIAKALGEPTLETAFRTRTGQVIGTLEYMSPEQARGEIARVDVRSDVYALGVIAYELLSERLPHDTSGLPLHEAVRRISEESHPPLRATITGAPRAGRVDADVDTIVGKCLAKEPDRRYGSAGELAEDLERYFDSRPILARPPSTAYQLRKLVGRHRITFGVAALVFAFLVVFAVTVTVQLGIQHGERARAEAAAARARQESRKSDRVVQFMNRLLSSANPDEAGGDATIPEVLAFVEPTIEETLAEEPEVVGAVLEAVGIIHREREEFDRADELLQRALAVRLEHLGTRHPDVASSYYELANLRFFQERLDEGERFAKQALEIGESLDEPDVHFLANALNTLGLTLRQAGSLEEAGRALARSVALAETISDPTQEQIADAATTRESLAGVMRRLGRYAEAEPLMREVVETRRTIAGGKPNSGVSTALYNLGAVLMHLGRHREAERALRSALEIEERLFGRETPWVAITVNELARTLLHLGRLDEAERLAREAEARHRASGEPYRRRLAQDLSTLSRVLAARGLAGEAEAAARESVATARAAVGEDHPNMAAALSALGAALEAAARWVEAETVHREAETILRGTAGQEHPDVAGALAARAHCLNQAGLPADALPLARDSLAIAGKIEGDHPRIAEAALALAESLSLLGQAEEATGHARTALAILRKQDHPDPLLVRRATALAG